MDEDQEVKEFSRTFSTTDWHGSIPEYMMPSGIGNLTSVSGVNVKRYKPGDQVFG
jgi:hypothetical protein